MFFPMNLRNINPGLYLRKTFSIIQMGAQNRRVQIGKENFKIKK